MGFVGFPLRWETHLWRPMEWALALLPDPESASAILRISIALHSGSTQDRLICPVVAARRGRVWDCMRSGCYLELRRSTMKLLMGYNYPHYANRLRGMSAQLLIMMRSLKNLLKTGVYIMKAASATDISRINF